MSNGWWVVQTVINEPYSSGGLRGGDRMAVNPDKVIALVPTRFDENCAPDPNTVRDAYFVQVIVPGLTEDVFLPTSAVGTHLQAEQLITTWVGGRTQ